jgi:hypothetical protein
VYSGLWKAQSQEASIEYILDGRGTDRTGDIKEVVE